MDLVQNILEKSAKEAEKYKPITVEKHLDLEYDLGALMACDNNALDQKALTSNKKDEYLLRLTRDNVQLLYNKIWELPTERVEEAIMAKLPPQQYKLPRRLPLPRPRPLTKWQQFAKEKGIQKTKKAKLSWDDQLNKWVPLYGFKKAQAEKDKNWVLEVPQNADPMEDQFAKKATAKGEKVAKNELQRLRNIAKAKNVKVPRLGLLNPDASSAKDLQTAVTVARASTASVGKFQNKLPHEKEARGVAAITPGASRKRKLPPVSGTQEKSENIAIVDTILNKRPKIDIEKAVSRHIAHEQTQDNDDKPPKGRKAGSRKNNSGGGRKKTNMRGSGAGKKPKGGQGQHKKGKESGGRKRR